MNDPTAKPVLASSDMRVAIAGSIGGILLILKAAGLHPTIFGYDLMSLNADQAAAWISSAGLFLTSTYLAWKRIQRGKDPSNTLQPIENPIATVKRLTNA